ncbi:hypothetical protein EC991_010654, partial [Linnemannia zychae]
EDENLNDPTDHHNHHRHQCDDEDCSDHDDSHHHLQHSENAPTPIDSYAFAPQQKPAPAPRSAMNFARPTMSSTMKKRAAPFQQQPHHHVNPFNAPAHVLHAVASTLKKAPIAAPKQFSSAPQPKPSAKPLLLASKAVVTPKATDKPHVASLTALPVALNRSNKPLLHEPFNAPAHLLHASKLNASENFKATTPVLKRKPAEPSEHLGRRVDLSGHHPSSSSTYEPQSYAHADNEGIDHNAHPTPKEDIADQQHAENRERGNSHGHHAHTVPTHRDHKIPRHPENEDPMDHHNHYRHQYDEAAHSPEPNRGNNDLVVSSIVNLGSLFNATNLSGPKAHNADHPTQPREHSERSFGHHGHHPQHDLNPVEGPEYDIEGPLNHRHQEQPLLPTAWFKEPIQNIASIHIARDAPADSAPEDPAERRHQENRQRGNSHGHHAHAVPAHRDHKPHHQHEYDDATDKHNHFRHQSHDENCGEHHDDLGNILPTAAGDSPLTSLGHLFSVADSSGLADYTYSEAVTHKKHHHTAAVTLSKTQKPRKAAPSQPREHLDRSFGHHGHHPQHDLNP